METRRANWQAQAYRPTSCTAVGFIALASAARLRRLSINHRNLMTGGMDGRQKVCSE